MKKITLIAFLFSLLAVGATISIHTVNAQMMGGYYGGTNSGYSGPGMMYGYYGSAAPAASTTSSDNGSPVMDTEEIAGQALAQKLQAKTLSCSSLSQSDFQSLGEYYMNLMMGSGHDAMDNYIVSRYGQAYDEQMHIAMGERFSGCNLNVAFPAGVTGFGPMMSNYGWNGNWSGYGMMGWGFPGMMGDYGFDGGWGWGTSIFMIILGVLAVVGIVSIIIWTVNYFKKR